jgi:ABC-type multidrug transport system ATPase subunit/ABC-type multidrug transport system permease subunit
MRGRTPDAAASQRDNAQAEGKEKPPLVTSDCTAPTHPHSEEEYAATIDAIKKQVRLDDIEDEEFRRALDPDTGTEALEAMWKWSDERQDQFVSLLKPAHLSLLMTKRVQAGLLLRAKTLTFRHLTVVQRGVEVLSDASGDLCRGEMVGLIGGPDSGVSPLLNALSQQLSKKAIKSGEVLYDSHPSELGYTQAVGFAVKQDSHIAALTVFESLYFSARTRLVDRLPDSAIRLRVKVVMKLLGLSQVSDSFVGDSMTRGISGGEKRRLGFGLEMVAGHSIILADLPTNGLDSATAFALLQTMSYACKMGIGVMLSIVQASVELLTVLDRIILLSKGRIIYIGKLDTVEQYLKDAGFVRPKNKALPQFLEELSSKPEQFYIKSAVNMHPTNSAVQSPNGPRSPDLTKEPSNRTEDSKAEHFPQTKTQTYSPKSPVVPNNPASVLDDQSSVQDGQAGQSSGERRETPSPTRVAFDQLARTYESSEAYQRDLRRVEGVHSGRTSQKSHRGQLAQPPATASVTQDFIFCTAGGQVLSGAQIPLPDPAGPPNQPASFPPSEATGIRLSDSRADVDGRQGDADVINRLESSSCSFLCRRWYRSYNSSARIQFKQNLYRHALLTYRNTGLWRDIWILAVLIGIISGSLFFQLGTDETGVHNRLGLYFYIISYLGFNAVQLAPVLARQRTVLSNQTRSGYYHPFAYFFSLLLVQMPIVLVEALLLLTPAWGLSRLEGMDWGGSFWFAYLVVSLASYTSRAYMFVVYGFCPNEAWADVLNQVSNIIFTKLCGYFIPQQKLVVGWHWVYYLSYYTFALRALALNDILPIARDCVPTPEAECLFKTGAEALELLYTMDPAWSKWMQVEYLFDFFICFSVIGFVAMWKIDWAVTDDWEVPYFESEEDVREELEQRQPQKSQLPGQRGRRPAEQRMEGKRRPASRRYSDIVLENNGGEQQNGEGSQGNDEPDRLSSHYGATQSSFHYQHRVWKQLSSPNPKDNHGLHEQDNKQSDQTRINTKKRDGVTIEFYKLCYFVKVKGKQRRLLHDVYGYCTPGMMVALMGTTGAGKSTLLDVLANKKTGGHMTGQILVNGERLSGDFQHVAGYVEQFDSHYPFSTIREALRLSGRLRLPRETSDDELDRMVDKTLRTLGLTHMQGELIGGEGLGGVSQEVRKKVTIGVELMLEPELLFLDEPTTGLDSAAAFAVMTTLRQLAMKIAVICTIHQPSAEIVLMFDWLLLMRPGGEVVYFNPVKHLPEFFKGKGLGECPKNKNIADFALDRIRTLDTATVWKAEEDKRGDNALGHSKAQGQEADKQTGEEKDQRHVENKDSHDQGSNQLFDQMRAQTRPAGKGQHDEFVNCASQLEGAEEQKDARHIPGQTEQDLSREAPASGILSELSTGHPPQSTRLADANGIGGVNSSGQLGQDSNSQQRPEETDQNQCGALQDIAKTFAESEEGKKLLGLLNSGVYNTYRGQKLQDAEIDERDAATGRHKDQETNTDQKVLSAASHKQESEHNCYGLRNDQQQQGQVEGKEKGAQIYAEPLTPIYVQFKVLLLREFLGRLRNRRNLGIRMFLAFFMALVVGTIFFQLGYDNYEADERISAIFVTLLFLMFTSNAFLPDLFSSRPMYFRETTAAMYTALPSFLARTLADLPFMLLEICILTIPIYFICGLNPQRGHSPLGWLMLGFLAVRWTSINCTLFIGTLVALPNNANMLQATYFNLQFAFTGFLIPAPSIPSWWKWFYDLCYLRWALAFLAANEANGEEFYCDLDQRVDIPMGYSACSLEGEAQDGTPRNLTGTKCGFTCGQDLLDYYGVSGSLGGMALDISVLWGFAAFFVVAAFLSLKLVNHVSR